jgi:hypothetical protein
MRNANFEGMHLFRVAKKRLGIALIQVVIERIDLGQETRIPPLALALLSGQLACVCHNLAPSFMQFCRDRLAGNPS